MEKEFEGRGKSPIKFWLEWHKRPCKPTWVQQNSQLM